LRIGDGDSATLGLNFHAGHPLDLPDELSGSGRVRVPIPANVTQLGEYEAFHHVLWVASQV
jgi:hypothetical protein